MQDKRAADGARQASEQPARISEADRAQQKDPVPDRSPALTNGSARLVKVTLWVKPAVKGELERLANQQREQKPETRLTLSATGGALLEQAVQRHVDMQYGALLEPVMRRIIQDENRAFRRHLTWLLLRIAFDVGQTRSLATNILNRRFRCVG